MTNMFDLMQLTDDQWNRFIEIVNRKILDYNSWGFRNAKFAGADPPSPEYRAVLSSIIIKITGDKLHNRRVMNPIKTVTLTLVCDTFQCYIMTADDEFVRNAAIMLQKEISKIWRRFLLTEFGDVYGPMLEEYKKNKKKELAEKQKREMALFNDEYNCDKFDYVP